MQSSSSIHESLLGWSDHFVSKRKYHLIIPAENEWKGRLLDDGGFLDSQTHLLHSLIHCNGYGHLLAINGYDWGSKPLRGQDLLDLFDRICTTLRVKEVTVEDTAKKQRMDLRLLHAVAYGQTWFGRWGYKLHHGSFGITTNRYQQAIEVLSSIMLDKLVQDLAKVSRDRAMKRIIANYQKSSPVDTAQLVTLGDLLRRMLDLKATLPYDSPQPKPAHPAAPTPAPPKATAQAAPAVGRAKKFAEVAAKLDSRWSVPRMELAAEVVVEALREARELGRRGMTRQDVRDAARLQIGDTGLLDFVLKSLGGCVVGAHLVRRTVNPATRVLEFSIQDLGAAALPSPDPSLMPPTPTLEEPAPKDQVGISRREEVERDVWYVYRQVFHEYRGEEMVGVAVQVIRDCKHFSKTWAFVDNLNDDNLRFFCGVIADAPDMEVLTRGVPACELVVLPPYATVGDLKRAGEAALRDTYLVMDRFTARSVDGVPSPPAASGLMEWEYKMEEQEGELLFGMVESGETVWLRGSGFDKVTELRYEGGADGWTVDCKCGATDDDGERMVACDVCEVWQHTRCAGYSDTDSPPKAFWCEPCSMVLDPRRFSSSSSPATCSAASRFLVTHDAAYGLRPSALQF